MRQGMRRRYILALGILVTLALAACSLTEPPITANPEQSATLPSPTISVSDLSDNSGGLQPRTVLLGATPVSPESAAEITTDDGAVLRIPPGSFDRETAVKITRLAESVLPRDTASMSLVADIYEIDLATAADFTQPVTLSIPYNIEGLPPGEESDLHALTVVWWDGDTWREVPSTVDLANGVVTAQIDHFSIFSAGWSKFKDLAYDAVGGIRSLNFDGTYKHGEFTIHYASKVSEWKPPRYGNTRIIADERPPPDDDNGSGVPDYIENLGRYFEESRVLFNGGGAFTGMKVPVSETIHVFVADLGYNPGTGNGVLGDASPLTSHIRIDNKLNDNQLKNVAAHELFQYWQFSQLWLKSGDKHRLWMEATAAWAMDGAFPDVNLYANEIKQEKPDPLLRGYADLHSRPVSQFYAAATFAKYLENRFPGFVMATFTSDPGLQYTESWHTTFDRLLREKYGNEFTQVFNEFVASYYYHWDFDQDIPLWFNNRTGPFDLANPGAIARDGEYQKLQSNLPSLSGQLITWLFAGDVRPGNLVVKQLDTPSPPMVLAFADNGTSENRSRVRLLGDQDRMGLVIEQGPLLAGGEPYKRLLLKDVGGATAGDLINQVHLIAVNNSRYSYQRLSLEIYLLQSPDNIEVENTSEGQVAVTWKASTLPPGIISKYRLYRHPMGQTPDSRWR